MVYNKIFLRCTLNMGSPGELDVIRFNILPIHVPPIKNKEFIKVYSKVQSTTCSDFVHVDQVIFILFR